MSLVANYLSMKEYLFLLSVFIPLIVGAPNTERSSPITTETIVKKHGYPFEEHFVQTADGYILGVHRIPYSARVNNSAPRPVAFLMHGLLCSSSDWVLLGPDNGLAYILSDAGYDVWMGNARGNTYSRKHVKYNPLLWNFWAFDWHEIGMIDLPAMIDYVRFKTGEDQVRYFGHSQGTTTFLLLNSLNLKFKSRIRSAHLLAPVAYMDHMESPLAKITSPLLGTPNALTELFGDMEFMPNSVAMALLGNAACRDSSPLQILCSNVLFLIAGYNEENLNTTLIPEIMETTPAGASINQVYHYLQVHKSRVFRQFDHGLIRNIATYGSKQPPNYPLEKIDVPVFLYYSDNDYFASVIDVHRLIRELPGLSMENAYRVKDPKWNHLDFLWGLGVKDKVYNVVMADIKRS